MLAFPHDRVRFFFFLFALTEFFERDQVGFGVLLGRI